MSERHATLVGRDAEIQALERALAAVRGTREAGAITVLGASGIGKSRLVRDFLVRGHAGDKEAPRVYRGSARENGPPYEVFARVLRARFGLVERMDPEAQKAQIRAQVASVLEDRKVGDVAYFLGQMLDLTFQDSPLIKAVEADPQQLHWMRRAVLRSFLEADALRGGGPLVLVFDDLQWAHDASLDKLSYLVENLRAPVLVVAIARPEVLARRDDWLAQGGARHTSIELSPLSDSDAAAVMEDLLAPCGNAEGVDDLVDAACTLAGGNPALLEQMVRIYMDAGVLTISDDFDDEKWSIHVDRLAHVRLPLTVEDAVQARIAALAPAERDLLERAAAVGGVFWVGALVAIDRLDAAAPDLWAAELGEDVLRIRALLHELTERDYVLRLPDSTFAGDEEYVFKHNLERETLARSTPPAAMRRYHRAVARWLSFKEPVRTNDEYLATLARHWRSAGAISEAAAAYLEAAHIARARYAHVKAAEHYARGLGLLDESGDADEGRRLDALLEYGDVLRVLGRHEESFLALHEMRTRAYRLDLQAKGGAAHGHIGRLFRQTGRLDDSARHLEAALVLFEGAEDRAGIATTLDDMAKLHRLRGDLAQALDVTERALSAWRDLNDPRAIAQCLHHLGLVHQDAGQYTHAAGAFEQALEIRRGLGDLVGASVTLHRLGAVARDQHDHARALSLFQEAVEIARRTGDRNRIALLLTNIGDAYSRLGDAATAIRHLKQAEELADELGDKTGLAEAVRGLGKAYFAQGELVKARECTARAVTLFSESESKVQLGIALRSLGEVIAAYGTAVGTGSPGGAFVSVKAPGGAEMRMAGEHLRRSIGIFEEIGNDVELARSCRSYAELLRHTSEHRTNPAVACEADALAKRADEIFTRLKVGTPSLPMVVEMA